MRVLGIDAGFANLAYCEVNSEDPTHPIRWACVRIMEEKFSEEKFFKAAYDWVQSDMMKPIFEAVDRIVLERQMTPKFAIVNHIIRALYYHKTVEYNPQTVGSHFGLARDRATKKKDAIRIVSAVAAFPVSKKKDDLADAYLLAIYDLQNFFHLLQGFNVGLRVEDNRASVGAKRRSVSLSVGAAKHSSTTTEHPVNTKRRLVDIDLCSSASSDSSS